MSPDYGPATVTLLAGQWVSPTAAPLTPRQLGPRGAVAVQQSGPACSEEAGVRRQRLAERSGIDCRVRKHAVGKCAVWVEMAQAELASAHPSEPPVAASEDRPGHAVPSVPVHQDGDRSAFESRRRRPRQRVLLTFIVEALILQPSKRLADQSSGDAQYSTPVESDGTRLRQSTGRFGPSTLRPELEPTLPRPGPPPAVPGSWPWRPRRGGHRSGSRRSGAASR
jgi:hypothetical protein